jgi:arginine decarboxylase
MAVSNAKKGERATAGVIFGWIHNKETGEKIGGMVCEHNGNYTEEEIREKLNASLNEMFTEYCKKYDSFNAFELRDITITIESIVPEKNYGTAMVVLCFVNYVYPIVAGEENE